MSSRSFRARALAAVLAMVAAGCQDYNFNPVGHCVIQPGTQRFTLSSVSSADVLFVVDDSGSMAGEQTRLANAFGDFVQNLTSTNVGRAQSGLLPLDFHVAVTTTSVFVNREPLGATQTCLANCGAAGPQLACCLGQTTPVYGPRKCSADTQCPVAGTACRNTCDGLKGEGYCCAPDGSFPQDAIDDTGGEIVRCSVAGAQCGRLETHYAFGGQCSPATQGVALDQLPFPDGSFVGSTNVATVAANPRVLHFDKRLYQAGDGKNAQGFDRSQLEAYFRQNVRVGTCGSPEEQGLAASRRALERALSSQGQADTYTYNRAAGLNPLSTPATASQFSVANGIPSAGARAEWPSPGGASKLVLVYVGDEDDCSSPVDPAGGVIMNNSIYPGDACTADSSSGAPKQRSVASFVDYFTGLGRPVGAAFIVSARDLNGNESSCQNDSCFAAICCDRACSSSCPDSGGVCGGQAPGTRFVEAGKQLKAKGADVVVGSICDNFGPLLEEVAEIVKPPRTLTLPSVPAESRIAVLRIATSAGETRKICGPPLAPPQASLQQAENTLADWWFSEKADPGPPFDPTGTATVAVPSKFVYINPKGSCIANPGETYAAEYLGVVPAGGCVALPSDLDGGGNVIGSGDCKDKLGGQFGDWACFVPPGLTTGTCTCRASGG